MDFGFLEQQYLSRALLDYANPGYWEGGGLRDTLVAVYKRKFWVILCCANPIVVCCGTMELWAKACVGDLQSLNINEIKVFIRVCKVTKPPPDLRGYSELESHGTSSSRDMPKRNNRQSIFKS